MGLFAGLHQTRKIPIIYVHLTRFRFQKNKKTLTKLQNSLDSAASIAAVPARRLHLSPSIALVSSAVRPPEHLRLSASSSSLSIVSGTSTTRSSPSLSLLEHLRFFFF